MTGNETSFKIVHAISSDGLGRFLIVNVSGEILDDAQGHGFRTKERAQRAAEFRFGLRPNRAWTITEPQF
jgi:hypothetical protein